MLLPSGHPLREKPFCFIESYPQRGKIPRELQVLELEQRTQEVERKMTQEGTTKSEGGISVN